MQSCSMSSDVNNTQCGHRITIGCLVAFDYEREALRWLGLENQQLNYSTVELIPSGSNELSVKLSTSELM